MAEADTTIRDYSTGAPRHHHSLYIEDGNLVLQVENAIFKVHRSSLAKQSSVIKDMLGAPQSSTDRDGTDEKPLVLTGDSAASWELLLESLYESLPFLNPDAFSGERILTILPIAHKYCMDKVEHAMIERLKKVPTTPGYVDLLVAAQIVGSETLYANTLRVLMTSTPKPNVVQARRIGADATFAIMDARLLSVETSLSNAYYGRCRHCNSNGNSWKCNFCNRHQAY